MVDVWTNLPLLRLALLPFPCGSLHDALHIAFHRLFVQAIELQAVRRRRPRGARPGKLLNRVQGVHEDSI